MIKVSDLLDLNKLGKMELVEVRPTYAYVDEKRTDTISGYSYCVVLTDHNYEKDLCPHSRCTTSGKSEQGSPSAL